MQVHKKIPGNLLALFNVSLKIKSWFLRALELEDEKTASRKTQYTVTDAPSSRSGNAGLSPSAVHRSRPNRQKSSRCAPFFLRLPDSPRSRLVNGQRAATKSAHFKSMHPSWKQHRLNLDAWGPMMNSDCDHTEGPHPFEARLSPLCGASRGRFFCPLN